MYMDNVLDHMQSLHIRIYIPWVNVNEHITARARVKKGEEETSKQIVNGFAGGKRFM